jgi:hypothetical protein
MTPYGVDLVGRWLKRHGRPLALYSDRHSIFEPQEKGRMLADAETQFSRALRELSIGLIRAGKVPGKGAILGTFGSNNVSGARPESLRTTPTWLKGVPQQRDRRRAAEADAEEAVHRALLDLRPCLPARDRRLTDAQ